MIDGWQSIGTGVVCGLSGICTVWAFFALNSMFTRARPPAANRYEGERRSELRSTSQLYRKCEPLVDELSRNFTSDSTAASSPLGRALHSQPTWRHWRPQEFLALKMLEGVLVGGTVCGLVAVTGFFTFAGLIGLSLAAIYPFIARQSVVAAANRRLKQQRLRLPFVVDQIALMMQAGANFEECLKAIVEDDPAHPLNGELAVVLAEIAVGRTRRDALLDLRDRIREQELADLVFAVTQGEELGTPLSSILTDQAEQMRVKRAQWGEKAAAEAEVQIVFPGMLVMVACLIVVIAPILLPAAFNVFAD